MAFVLLMIFSLFTYGIMAAITPMASNMRVALRGLRIDPDCAPNSAQTVASFDISRLLEGITTDYGYPDYCENALQSSYCRLFLQYRCVLENGETVALGREVFTCFNPYIPAGGLCVTSNRTKCPMQALENMLKQVSLYSGTTSEVIQVLYGYDGLCVDSSKIPAICGNRSYTVLSPVCNLDGGKDILDSRGSSIVIFSGAAVVGLALICTAFRALAECHARNYTSERHWNKGDDSESLLLQSMDQPQKKFRPLIPQSVQSFMSFLDLRLHFRTLWASEGRAIAKEEPSTAFFDGVRVAALTMVIYGHTLYFPYTLIGPENAFRLEHYLQSYASVGIYPAVLAVDVFFFLSGYLAMNAFVKAKTLCAWRDVPIAYIHRYLRLTPNVAAALVYAVFILPYATGGVLRSSSTRSPIIATCVEYWWTLLAYVANLRDIWSSCLGWFWYLCCDMQLFLVVPWFALVYRKSKVAGCALLVATILTGCGLAYEYQPFSLGEHYIKSYFRFPPYVWGMLCAGIIRENWVRQLVSNWQRRAAMHILAVGLFVMCINLIWKINVDNNKLTTVIRGVCNLLVMLTWGMAMTLISMCWCWHPEGYISGFLRHSFFVITSRLTYAMYVVHPLWIMTVAADAYHIPSFTPIEFYRDFGGNWIASAVIAIGLAVLVEQPAAIVVRGLMSLIVPRRSS